MPSSMKDFREIIDKKFFAVTDFILIIKGSDKCQAIALYYSVRW